MQFDPSRKLADVVATVPYAATVFSNFGIDCRASRDVTVGTACDSVGIDSDAARRAIERMQRIFSPTHNRVWWNEAVTSLMRHLVQERHPAVRDVLGRTVESLRGVEGVAGDEGFTALVAALQTLQDEFVKHVMREENVLFPAIDYMERCRRFNETPSAARVYNLERLVEELIGEQQALILALIRLNETARKVLTPRPGVRGDILNLIYELELEIREEIRVERDVVYPRAIRLESELRRARHDSGEAVLPGSTSYRS